MLNAIKKIEIVVPREGPCWEHSGDRLLLLNAICLEQGLDFGVDFLKILAKLRQF